MDYAQKRLDFEQSDRLSTMTEEEKKKLGERKAQELQKLMERADAALAGNKKLLEKRESERMAATTVDEKKKLQERTVSQLDSLMERADLAFAALMERTDLAFAALGASSSKPSQ